MPFSLYRKFAFFILAAFLLASCISQKSSVATKPKSVQNDLIDYGKKYLHKPYRYAGKGPNSFDCSGFTSFVFKEFGYSLNSSSAGQAAQAETVKRKEDLQVGDLVFFEGRSRNGIVGHVGIVSEVKHNGKFKFLHASTNYGVIFSASDEPYYKARYLRGGRVLKDIEPKKKKEVEPNEKILLAQHIPDKPAKMDATQSFSVKKNDNGAENNFTKTEKQTTTHVRNADGTISVHVKRQTSEKVSIEPEQAMKPKKNEKSDDEKSQEKSEIRQTAIVSAEESTLPAPIRTTHVVKVGETLFSISKKHKCTVEQLQKWNPEVEDNIIYAGDKLTIYR
ncbi:MAG: NlpC/P60 family protein [Dysgonamonadaceae bacterium]